MTTTLKGITWDHSRGYVSLVAASQRFTELNPDIKIEWEKRSLKDFEDFPIDTLASTYDLMVIDHPWAGFAASQNILVRLEECLSGPFLQDQEQNSVGPSHISYNFNGFQSALALDAAAPVAVYRPDLIEKYEVPLPRNWNELLQVAKGKKVAYAGKGIYLLMDFYMMVVSQGEEPGTHEDIVVSAEVGEKALEQMRELASLCPPQMFDWNPIDVCEQMSANDDLLLYSPFCYGYVNYSRRGYAKHRLKFTDLVKLDDQTLLRSTLGGTGLAISNKSRNVESAVRFMEYTLSPAVQRTLYFESGGQPGHKAAWEDEEVNRQSLAFFKDTLPTLERAYVRPRYPGYLQFQEQAGEEIRSYLIHGGSARSTLKKLDQLYRDTKKGEGR
ncbi:extracellular solute-binding protein [Alkalihalobacillus oceani]|uniref:Extracellular solute-binding protein n=1 Tax=Halalkalibacter oceani TaxID=1653776 RepID=A0A9X2IQI4_9BACI|nr:extracellular solute-binding protein [Halalkalibacter oceani]MCM3715522.1 extracellular solute-binding protein [Halalkalibacter oceani]